MMSVNTEVTPRRAAQIAGYGYLAIFVLAIFANFLVRQRLVEPGDAATTVVNIMESEGLFRAGLIAFLVVFALDVVIAWALYVLFRAVNRDLSLLTAWFRLVYTTLLGVGVVSLFAVLQLLGGAEYLSAFQAGQLEAHVTLSLEAFNYAWLIGLACFGVHLVLLGYLIIRSGYAARALGYVLMVAGVAYVSDTLAHAILPNYGDVETLFGALVAVPAVIAELWFALWLLLRAGKASVELISDGAESEAVYRQRARQT